MVSWQVVEGMRQKFADLCINRKSILIENSINSTNKSNTCNSIFSTTLKTSSIPIIVFIMSQSTLQIQNNLKVAHLETIDFSKLLAHEEAEVSKLMSACTTAGFFYVDLQGQSGRGLLEDEDSMYKAMAEFFDQPLDVKKKEERGTHKHG
jgi:hypothetical protein